MRSPLFIFLLVICLHSYAQKQRGQILESSVTSQEKIGLSGVKVCMRGNTNSYVTDSKGFFSMSMHSYHKTGIPYFITEVSKKGFELADPSIIGRPLAYSPKELMRISMLSSKKLNDERIRIEQNVYKATYSQLNLILSSLKDSLDKELIAAETYRKRRNELEQQLKRYKPLISIIADHYARMDYSLMDKKELEVCLKIKDGEFAKADSLLSFLENEWQRQHDIYNKEKDDVADDLYNKYVIAIARFDSKKAGEYIYLRAEVDSCNINCLLDAGVFACEYASDFPRAATYYDNAIIQAKRQYGEESGQYALCLNHKGGLLLEQSRFAESLEYREKALRIRTELFGEKHASVAACCNNIANIYYAMSDMEKAKEYAQKAVFIYQNVDDCIASEYASALNTLGGVSLAVGEMDFAATLFDDAIKICNENYGEFNVHSATALNDKGVVLDYIGKSGNAIDCYRRAIQIYNKVYGAEHPTVATLYDNLGDSYKKTGQLDSAMVYMSKSLDMRLNLFGEFHEDVAVSLNNLGSFCSSMKMYDLAIDFYGKCLTIWETILGKNHERFATTIGNLGVLYYRQNNYSMALTCFEDALSYYVQKAAQYPKELKSIGGLAALCYHNLLKDETLPYHNQLKDDFEEFKKKYSIYIRDKE